MNELTKRILIIVGFVVLTAGLGYLIYFIFFRPAVPTVAPSAPAVVPMGGLPTAGTGAPAPSIVFTPEVLPAAPVVPSAAVVAPVPAAAPSRTVTLTGGFTQAITASAQKDGVRSFNPADGRFYKILSDGTMIPLSDQTFYNVQDVTWGNTTDKAVLGYPDGSKILFDFQKDQQYTLPKYWEDFNFSPQDDKIAAKSIGNNETNRFLVISNPDGTDARPVAELGNNQDKVHVSWSPNNQVVAFSQTGDPMGMDTEQIILVGQHQENFKGLIVEGRGFISNWSPSGNNLLYSVYSSDSNFKPQLWVSGASGDNINANRRRLDVQTWADKCTWQNETTIYCAVPNNLGDGAGLQRDLFSDLSDTIVKIDLQSGTKTVIGQPDGNPAIQQMVLSSDGSYLFYTDRSTGKLSRYTLTP